MVRKKRKAEHKRHKKVPASRISRVVQSSPTRRGSGRARLPGLERPGYNQVAANAAAGPSPLKTESTFVTANQNSGSFEEALHFAVPGHLASGGSSVERINLWFHAP